MTHPIKSNKYQDFLLSLRGNQIPVRLPRGLEGAFPFANIQPSENIKDQYLR